MPSCSHIRFVASRKASSASCPTAKELYDERVQSVLAYNAEVDRKQVQSKLAWSAKRTAHDAWMATRGFGMRQFKIATR